MAYLRHHFLSSLPFRLLLKILFFFLYFWQTKKRKKKWKFSSFSFSASLPVHFVQTLHLLFFFFCLFIRSSSIHCMLFCCLFHIMNAKHFIPIAFSYLANMHDAVLRLISEDLWGNARYSFTMCRQFIFLQNDFSLLTFFFPFCSFTQFLYNEIVFGVR